MYDCETFTHVNPFSVNVEQHTRETGNGVHNEAGIFECYQCPTAIYLFVVKKEYTRTRCKIWSKFRITTPE